MNILWRRGQEAEFCVSQTPKRGSIEDLVESVVIPGGKGNQDRPVLLLGLGCYCPIKHQS